MNIFEKIGVGILDVGKWFGEGLKDVIGLSAKLKTIMEQEKPLEKPLIDGLSTVCTDLEQLFTLSASAVTADGLNFAEDSAAYQQFLKLYNDLKALAPTVEAEIALLKSVA